jgi:DNA primase
MRFEETFPDILKSQIKISEIIAKKISIKHQSSGKFIACCPFHKEKTPSFHIDDQKEFYHCFGCGVHGNIFNFVMEMENLPFFEAVTKIANDYNISIPYLQTKEIKPEEKKVKDRSFEIQKVICQFFENNLYDQNDEQALKYLHSRSLSRKIIKKFQLGFASKDSNKLLEFLNKSGFLEMEILESGVFSRGQNNIYCRFKNRVIFPISNNKNQIIAYGGRVLDDSMPKYLNSPETKLFQKRNNLYNFSRAKKEIYGKKYAILVEGYMDVISLDNYQIENVVAPLGTSVTIDQLNILLRITDQIIICLDGDDAGIRGAKRIIDLTLPIINANNNIKFAFLPNKMDPDDFIKVNGKEEMLNFLESSKNLSEILFQFETEELSINILDRDVSPEKKTILESNLRKKTELIKDANTKRNFNQYYSNLLFSIGRRGKSYNQNESIKKNYINFNNNINQDLILGLNILNLTIKFPELLQYQDKDLTMLNINFENDVLEILREEIFDKIAEKSFSIEDFQQFIKTNVSENLAMIEQKIFTKNNIKDQDIAIIHIKIHYFKILYKKIELEKKECLFISDPELDGDGFSKTQEIINNYKTDLERKILDLEKKFNI